MKHHLYLIFAMVIVGSSVTSGKFVTNHLPVNFSMFMRFFIAVATLYLIGKFKKIKIVKLNIRDGIVIAIQALMGSVLFNVFLLNGLKTVPAVSAGIITASTPIMVAILSVIFLGEKLGILRIISIAVSTTGIILVKNIPEHNMSSASFNCGFLMVIAAAFVESCFLIFRKKLKHEIDSFSLSFYLSMYGMLFFAPSGIMEAHKLAFASITTSEYFVIIYYGLFITVAAYLLWMEGIKYVDATIASVYTAFMPLSAIVTSWIVLRENIGIMQIYGLIMIIISLAIVMYDRD